MKRALFVLLWGLLLALAWGSCARANVPTKPYTFAPNTTIFSAQVNADFDTLYTLLNGGLDSTNISAARGIGANYIVSAGSGNSGLFQAGGYTFTAGSTTQVPLIVNGAAGQSADLLDLNVNGVNKAAFNSAGVLSIPGAVNSGYEMFTGTTGAGSSSTWLAGAGPGLQLNIPSGKAAFVSVAGTQTISLGSALIVGAGNTGASAGDGAFGRTTSTGAIFLGGTASSATIDYGVSTASKLTLAAATNVTGLLGANGGLSTTTATFSGAITANGGMAVADNNSINYGGQPVLRSDGAATILQGRTAASGIYIQNAASTANNINFPDAGGISVIRGGISGASSVSAGTGSFSGALSANSLSATGAVSGASGSFSGAISANGGHLPPAYTVGGADAGTVHLVTGSGTNAGANSGFAVTLSGNAAFSSSSSYTVICTSTGTTPGSACMVNQASGTSFTVYATASLTTVQWIALGW